MNTLDKLKPGHCATVVSVSELTSLYRRLSDLGITPGTQIGCISRSPLGDPSAYTFRGAVIALRRADATYIRVK